MTTSDRLGAADTTADTTVEVADRYRSEAEKTAVRMESYVNAVCTVLAAQGRRFYAARGTFQGKDYEVIAVDRTAEAPHPYPPAPTDIATLSSQWEYWTCQSTEADWRQADNLLGRYHLLDAAIAVLTDEHAAPTTMAESFEDWPETGGFPALDGIQVAMLAAWWDDRMAEGHTSATSRLLLSLTLPPHLVGCVTYDENGTPTLNPRPAD